MVIEMVIGIVLDVITNYCYAAPYTYVSMSINGAMTFSGRFLGHLSTYSLFICPISTDAAQFRRGRFIAPKGGCGGLPTRASALAAPGRDQSRPYEIASERQGLPLAVVSDRLNAGKYVVAGA